MEHQGSHTYVVIVDGEGCGLGAAPDSDCAASFWMSSVGLLHTKHSVIKQKVGKRTCFSACYDSAPEPTCHYKLKLEG